MPKTRQICRRQFVWHTINSAKPLNPTDQLLSELDLSWILQPFQGIAILRSTGLPRHPEYHMARVEMIRYLLKPSFKVAYQVRSRAMPSGGKSGKRRRLNIRMPHHRHDQIDLDNCPPEKERMVHEIAAYICDYKPTNMALCHFPPKHPKRIYR